MQPEHTGNSWTHRIQQRHTGYNKDTQDTTKTHRIQPSHVGYNKDLLDTSRTHRIHSGNTGYNPNITLFQCIRVVSTVVS